jgi:hypothetical protein
MSLWAVCRLLVVDTDTSFDLLIYFLMLPKRFAFCEQAASPPSGLY